MKYLSGISAVPLPIRLAAISFLFSLSVQSSSIFQSLYADDLGASRFQVGLIGLIAMPTLQVSVNCEPSRL